MQLCAAERWYPPWRQLAIASRPIDGEEVAARPLRNAGSLVFVEVTPLSQGLASQPDSFACRWCCYSFAGIVVEAEQAVPKDIFLLLVGLGQLPLEGRACVLMGNFLAH